MVTKDDLQAIKRELRLIARTKAAIQAQLKNLQDMPMRMPASQIRTQRDEDFVASNVLKRDELFSLLESLELSNTHLDDRISAVKADLMDQYDIDSIDVLILEMYYLQDISWENIAEVLNMSKRTCMRKKSSALKKLKVILDAFVQWHKSGKKWSYLAKNWS